MVKWLIVGVALFLVAAMYAACILAGRADDREERWFDGRHDKQKSGD